MKRFLFHQQHRFHLNHFDGLYTNRIHHIYCGKYCEMENSKKSGWKGPFWVNNLSIKIAPSFFFVPPPHLYPLWAVPRKFLCWQHTKAIINWVKKKSDDFYRLILSLLEKWYACGLCLLIALDLSHILA